MPTNTTQLEKISFEDAVQAARMAGRHDSPERLNHALRAGDLEGDQLLAALAAYKEGQEARAAGSPCLCIECQTSTPKLIGNEIRRYEFTRTRLAELTSLGMSEIEAQKVIAQELANGAAL